MPPAPNPAATPLEALALAYQRLIVLSDAGRWDDIEALSAEIGVLCDMARKVTAADLSDPRLLTASQRIVALQPILAERFGAQLEELQSLLAATRNSSRLQQNYGSTP